MLPIAIAVVEHDGQVLIGRRADDTTLGGLWEFPGGKIRESESPAEAAVRECQEETGLTVEVVSLDSTVEHQYDRPGQEPLCVRLHFFRCRPRQLQLAPLAPFRWVPHSELKNYEFPAANQAIVAALMR
ncbi:MAG: (deoxy)nucleoside triphosphate pyrophosphohydrolase [Planctomycetes bacterium]|nr:(deoxy)nucleoside triphosphate pyrophosphohydrolase [Planctomycetota bacterium]